jgi:hypothetical protein
MLGLGKKEKAPIAEPVAEQAPPRHDTINSVASTDAVPAEKGDIGALFVERLQAWKHAVGYLEAYVESTEKVHKELSKEYEKVLKVGFAFYPISELKVLLTTSRPFLSH